LVRERYSLYGAPSDRTVGPRVDDFMPARYGYAHPIPSQAGCEQRSLRKFTGARGVQSAKCLHLPRLVHFLLPVYELANN
jgi:hypothetical protein